jgi:hypothetical protein
MQYKDQNILHSNQEATNIQKQYLQYVLNATSAFSLKRNAGT